MGLDQLPSTGFPMAEIGGKKPAVFTSSPLPLQTLHVVLQVPQEKHLMEISGLQKEEEEAGKVHSADGNF